MRYVFDLETDGLLDTVTRIWCIVAFDPDAKRVHKFTVEDNNIHEGVKLLANASQLITHNGLGFDVEVLKKLYNVDVTDITEDTYVLSQMFYPNEMEQHGLSAWGEKYGVPKPEHEEWDRYSPEMLERCIQDVRITTLLWSDCEKELNSWDWEQSKKLEYDVLRAYSYHMTRWRIDKPLAEKTLAKFLQLKNEYSNSLLSKAPIKVVRGGKTVELYTAKGAYRAAVLSLVDKGHFKLGQLGGPFCKVEFQTLNLNSPPQVCKWLLDLGWRVETYTKKGNPSMKDSQFYGVPEETAKTLRLYKSVCHRISLLKSQNPTKNTGLLNKLDDNDTVETFAYTCGTNTARFRHANVTNIPGKGKPFGEEMRAIFICDEGYKLMGCDVSALEACVEGHYTYPYDNGKYARFLTEENIHDFNAASWDIERPLAKTLNFAITFGGSPKRVKIILGCSDARAKQIHAKYFQDRPALVKLMKAIEDSLINRGHARKTKKGYLSLIVDKPYIRGIDGRKLYVRQPHKAKNLAIQSGGAIIVKRAFVKLSSLIEEHKLDARILCVYHDEFQVQFREKDQELLKKLCVEAVAYGGTSLGIRLPIKGVCEVGNSWADTH